MVKGMAAVGGVMSTTFASYMRGRIMFEEKVVELMALTGWTQTEAMTMIRLHWVAHGGTLSASADALIDQAKRGEFDGSDTKDRG